MSKTFINKAIIYLIFILLGFGIGQLFKKPEVALPVQKEKEVVEQEIPECFAGRCPEYFSMDVDEDGLSESVVIVPTAMTQGAGKLLIIDKGRVVFESDKMMRIFVKQTLEQRETGNGFTLLYGTEVNSSKGSEIKFIYQDKQFKRAEN